MWTHTPTVIMGGGLWPYVALGRTHVAREGAEAGYPLNWQLASPAQHTVTCSGVPPALHEALADLTTQGQAELRGPQSALYRHPFHSQGPCSVLALKTMTDSGY